MSYAADYESFPRIAVDRGFPIFAGRSLGQGPCAVISLAEIRQRLAARRPSLLSQGVGTPAAVALILRDAAAGPDVLFIERARSEGDPWSGHLAFPGGRVEPGDGGARLAAERETAEEIGLDLGAGEYLGRLDDLDGAHQPVVVSCFVYGLSAAPVLVLNEEVADAFWFPLEGLLDPARRAQMAYPMRGRGQAHPAIRLLEPGRPLLWGLTYRMVSRFLEVLGCAVPMEAKRS